MTAATAAAATAARPARPTGRQEGGNRNAYAEKIKRRKVQRGRMNWQGTRGQLPA
jgi:hypothetical protein